MDYIDNGTPIFDGHNYEIWIPRMKVVLKARGYDLWYSVVTGYTSSKKPPKNETKKELERNKKIEMDVILDALPDLVKVKMGQCSSTKELWDKIHNL
jgi:hypothetical protein